MNKQRIVDAFEKNRPSKRLTEEEMMLMINILMSKDPEFQKEISQVDKNSEIYDDFKSFIDGFLIQVFLKRLKHSAKLRITLGALVLIGEQFENPAHAVMYAFYLHNKLPSDTLITVNKIMIELFPFGYFSKEQLNDIWKEQKVRSNDDLKDWYCFGVSDNLLDYMEAWNK